MSDYDVRMVVLSTDDLDESIRFYSETLGMSLKFRDGAHLRSPRRRIDHACAGDLGGPPHSRAGRRRHQDR